MKIKKSLSLRKNLLVTALGLSVLPIVAKDASNPGVQSMSGQSHVAVQAPALPAPQQQAHAMGPQKVDNAAKPAQPTANNAINAMPHQQAPMGIPNVFQDMKFGHYHPENIDDAIKHGKTEIDKLKAIEADKSKMDMLKPEKRAKFILNLKYALADLEYLESKADKRFYWTFGKLMRHVHHCYKSLKQHGHGKWGHDGMMKHGDEPSKPTTSAPAVNQAPAPTPAMPAESPKNQMPAVQQSKAR